MGYILQLLLLDSSLIMERAGGVLRSSFNGLHEDNAGLATETICGSSDRSSDSIEPESIANQKRGYVVVYHMSYVARQK